MTALTDDHTDWIVRTIVLAALALGFGFSIYLILGPGAPPLVNRYRSEAADTVARIQAAGCQLLEVDRHGYSAFDCHGVHRWYDRYVTEAWPRDGKTAP